MHDPDFRLRRPSYNTRSVLNPIRPSSYSRRVYYNSNNTNTAPTSRTFSSEPSLKSLSNSSERSHTLLSQTVSTEASRQANQTNHLVHSKLQVVLIGMALFVFGLGLLVNFETLQTNHNAKAQISALANHSGSSDVPSQQKLTTNAIKNYQVAPNLPKYLIISKLSIYARILQVGVTNTGALGTPPDIYDTAWYTGSATPGEPASDGAVLIDGHVHGPTLPGVFMNIKSLVPGDSIQIVKGDNQTYTYTVNKVMTVPVNQVNMKQLLTSYQPSSQGLNLITCGGPFDKRTWQYTKRVEVFTSLSQSI